MNFLKDDANASAAGLTEFEGCLVTELGRMQPCTAYQLRRSFLGSPSQSWSGSAGAVYPAVRKLAAAGLVRIEGDASDKRGRAPLTLTEAGEQARRRWICDPLRAADSGFDPFRTRVTLLDTLPPAERDDFARELRAALQIRIRQLEAFMQGQDAVTRARASIDIAQQRVRLAWLDAPTGGPEIRPSTPSPSTRSKTLLTE